MGKKENEIRVLLVKHIVDGHDRGAKIVLKLLRNEGFETVYSFYRVPEDIVTQAEQEAVDVIAISTSSRVWEIHIPELIQCLKEKNMKNEVSIFIGGILGSTDEKNLLAMGVDAVYGPGKDLSSLSSKIREFASK